nr:uncharacterized protein LOC105343022 isoform X4 [Crassostrea gigas]XP_034334029.1 uncharacterized protein LOC105343022 isoform X4 [Crassostrea gigas]
MYRTMKTSCGDCYYGQCPDTAGSTLITSCDGIEKIGSFIEIDFNKINRPCICVVTLLFEGVLIGTTRKAPTWCPNPVSVNTTTVLDCNGASDTADVKINDTLVVKAEYQPGQTSVEFYQCLVLRENGGGGGNLSVVCGKQQVITSTTKTSTRLSEIKSSPEVSSLKTTSTTNDQYTYSFTTQSTTRVSGIETSEVSSTQSTSARNKNETYTIATVTTKWNPEIESSSAVSNSLIKSTSTSYERDTDSVTDSTTLSVVPDSLLENISCGLPFPFLIVILAVISSFSVFLNIWFIIQICLRKAKETRLKKGNIKIKSEKETYMELNERDKTCHENQYDSLTYPNNYIDISDL